MRVLSRGLTAGLAVVALSLGVWLGATGTAPGVAGAQPAADDSGQSAEEHRAQAFQAVDGAIEEDVPGGPLLLAAYGVIWLAIFGYAFRLVGLQRRTLEEVERLQAALREHPAPGPASEE